MIKFSLLACGLVALMICGAVEVFSSPVYPTLPGKDSNIFWYPKDDGSGYVPALLHGGPKIDTKAAYDDIRFFLYTRAAPNQPFELLIGNLANLGQSNYDKLNDVKIVSHGFTGNANSGSTISIKNGYLNSKNLNVIAIEWGRLAAAPWYETAAGHTRLVGEKTAELIHFLVEQGASLSQFHVIGHSLGAHVAGFAGAALNGEIARITALDPALPLFGQVSDEGRIDPTDALYVDVIHCAGGTLLDGGLAFREARGHADFYPNSGENQPGCGVDAFGSCSHSRAHEYFTESLSNTNGFRSCRCTDWDEFKNGNCACSVTASMGDAAPSNARGLYYLHTNSRSPFALG